MYITLSISAETSLIGHQNTQAFEESTAYADFCLVIHTGGKEETGKLHKIQFIAHCMFFFKALNDSIL